MESKILGVLKQRDNVENWWTSAPTNVPLVEAQIPFTFMDYDAKNDPSFLEEAEKALANFIKLDSFYKLQIAQNVFENFVDYCSYIDEAGIPENMKGAQPLSIWNHIHPTQVFLNRRESNDKDIYVVLTCECEWDKEHGLQLVFRQGKKLTRVSDQDGHLTDSDAFGFDDKDDKLLSSF